MNFLEIRFLSLSSARRRVYPSKWVIHLLFNSAPRKFKNLGTDAFIASRIIKFFLVIQDVHAIKVWGPVKNIKKCHQLLTFGFDANGSEILESHFRNIFNVHSM